MSTRISINEFFESGLTTVVTVHRTINVCVRYSKSAKSALLVVLCGFYSGYFCIKHPLQNITLWSNLHAVDVVFLFPVPVSRFETYEVEGKRWNRSYTGVSISRKRSTRCSASVPGLT